MTRKSIDPFDPFYCMSAHDPRMAFAVREIYQTYGDKTCVNRTSIHRYGGNGSVGTTAVPINSWGIAETYQTSNVTLNMSSSSASDTMTVVIEYLYFDGNGDMIQDTMVATLNGQTPVALPSAGCRWNRIILTTLNVGDIYIYRGTATAGVPDILANTHCQVLAGTGISQKAAISLPKTTYLILTQGWADIVKKQDAAVAIRYRGRVLPNDFIVQPRRSSTTGDSLSYDLDPCIILPPNSDLEVTAEATTGADNDVTAGFDGYFADIIST